MLCVRARHDESSQSVISRCYTENHSVSVGSQQGLTCLQAWEDKNGVHALSTPRSSALKVSEGDRFVTVWTHPAGSNPSAEQIAIRTSANTEVAALTAWTLIHALNASGIGLRASGTRAIASPIGRLATAIRVKLATARGFEGKATPCTGDNTHIVTLS